MKKGYTESRIQGIS